MGNHIKSIVTTIVIVLLYWAGLYFLPDIIPVHPAITIVTLTILYIAGWYAASYLFDKKTITMDSLIDSILRKLQKEGFVCGKHEGVLYYEYQGRSYYVAMWDWGKGMFKVNIIDSMSFGDEWGALSFEGKTVLADAINRKFAHARLIPSDKGVAVHFETWVKDAKDFLKNIPLSYEYIGGVCQEMEAKMTELKANYPAGGRQGYQQVSLRDFSTTPSEN